MKKLKKILSKYKVLLTAIVASLTLTLQQFVGVPEVSWKAIGLAALLGVVGVVGNFLRGQYVSMAGIIGIASMAISEVAQGHVINWQQLMISLAVAFLALVSPPPKLRSYENDPTIKSAKE